MLSKAEIRRRIRRSVVSVEQVEGFRHELERSFNCNLILVTTTGHTHLDRERFKITLQSTYTSLDCNSTGGGLSQ